MSRKNESWGIEVGANAIKALRLSRTGSEVVLKDFEILPFKQILTTPDINAEEMVRVGLDSLLTKHELGNATIIVSVPGHMGFARFAKLPPVEPKMIPGIVQFEAVQQIPFPIEQVEWDYQVFQQADSPDVEVGIFAITKERVLNYLTNFSHVNLRVDGLTQSPLAVYNAFHYDREGQDDEGVIYMDIGTRSTDVIIAEQGSILPRTLPIGGNHFTEALVKAFKLSFPKAEKLKREAGTSKYARQIFQAMRPVFADLVQELQRSLGYYQSINRDANLTKLIGVGSTFRLPGLQKFLKQQLQIEVVRPDGYERISAEGKREAEFTEHAINMATAYGLALQGLGLETVSANLLPQHILTQRMWKAKQPWFAASAACVAVAAGVLTGTYITADRGASSDDPESGSQVTAVTDQAQRNYSAWMEVAQGDDPREQIENLRGILDYRDVWPKLLEDLSHAVAAVNPQPETVEADYDQMRTIPRDERRRVYIDSFNAQYIAEASRTSSSSSSRSGAMGGASDKLGRVFSVDDFFNDNTRPPRFAITVRGTTPHRDGAAFISNYFLQWLNDNAERLDRPYRIVLDMDQAIRSMEQITQTDIETTRGGRRTPSPRSIRSSRGSVSSATQDLLPPRPLSEEGRVGDWQFDIRWEVELLPPHEARHDREAAPPDEDESSPDTADVPAQADRSEQKPESQAERKAANDVSAARDEEAQL